MQLASASAGGGGPAGAAAHASVCTVRAVCAGLIRAFLQSTPNQMLVTPSFFVANFGPDLADSVALAIVLAQAAHSAPMIFPGPKIQKPQTERECNTLLSQPTLTHLGPRP